MTLSKQYSQPYIKKSLNLSPLFLKLVYICLKIPGTKKKDLVVLYGYNNNLAWSFQTFKTEIILYYLYSLSRPMQYVYYPDGTQHMYSTQMIDDVTRLSHTADNNIGLNIQYWPWQVNSLQSVTSYDMLDEYQNLLCWCALSLL